MKLQYLGVNLFIKRDDLYPISGGGNKGRKAEYILAKCVADGKNAVVTCGGEQSNHVRATAIRCKELGLACTIVIHAPNTKNNEGNLKLLRLLGAKIVFCDMADVANVMDDEMAEYVTQGYSPFYIWGGGHCIEGTQAYYDAALEAQEQSDITFDYVFHASGTGTTQAGLHLGFKTVRPTTQVIGVSVARQNPRGTEAVVDSIKEFTTENKLASNLSEDVMFNDSFMCGGYENTSSEQLEMIKIIRMYFKATFMFFYSFFKFIFSL